MDKNKPNYVFWVIGCIFVYAFFFGLIGFTVWWTSSAWCLWALLLCPSMKWKDGKDSEIQGEDNE